MRVGIQTWGSEGDIRPFLALARGLIEAGHDVTVAYTAVDGRDWRTLAQELGCPLVSVGAEVLGRRLAEVRATVEAELSSANPLEQVEVVHRHFFVPIVTELYEAALELARTHDVLVGHFLVHPAATAAQKLGRPYVPVFTAPVLPSREYPPMGAPNLGPLNRLTWRLASAMADRVLLGSVNALRRAESVPPLRAVFDDEESPPLTLTAVSPTLFSRPSDWAPCHQLCGFFSSPPEVQPWQAPPELEAFLSGGAPPAYLTFGSMLDLSPKVAEEGTRLLVEAARLSGRRAIVQAPWKELPAFDLPDQVFPLTRAPHGELFPRCALVVHHGGAGTTQSACLAGCPSVVVPHLVDQFSWGEVLRKAGVAPRALPRKRATPRALARRMEEALGEPRLAEQAAVVSAAMTKEGGVSRAIELITSVVASGPPSFPPSS